MGRARKPEYANFPKNLSFDKSNGTYRYIHPHTKKPHHMGKNKQEAMDAAHILNSKLMRGQSLVAKVLGTGIPLIQWIDKEFEKRHYKRRKKPLSPKTIRGYEGHLKRIKKGLGHFPIDSINQKYIAKFLDEEYGEALTNSNRGRSLLIVIFRYIVADGLINQNPALNTLPNQVAKERGRLTQKGFDAIYNHKEAQPWFKNAMDLALITLRREEDICLMKFTYCYPEGYKILDNKTKVTVLLEMGNRFKEIVRRCRDELLSPYLVHRRFKRPAKGKTYDHSTQVTGEFLSKTFKQLRDKTGLWDHLKPRQRPTFHEIKSLGYKVYDDMKLEPPAAHLTETMKKLYREGHERIIRAATL